MRLIARDGKVGAADVSGGKNDVFRRNIAVHDAHVVHRGKPSSDAVEQGKNVRRLEAAALQNLRQRFAVDELHDEEAWLLLVAQEIPIADDGIVADALEFAGLSAEQLDDLLVAGDLGQGNCVPVGCLFVLRKARAKTR
jgi:hypothetical protein